MKESAMPAETTSVLGLFRDEDSAAAAIKEMVSKEMVSIEMVSKEMVSIEMVSKEGVSMEGDINKTGDWHLERVHSPIPSHKLAEALSPKKSRVGWFTLAGGITGFFTGFGLASFTALRWSLIVGGKPIVALVPFFIVGFEFTILFAVFGNVIGLISQMGLPRKMRRRYDRNLSGDRFGLLATCDPGQKAELIAFFETRGAEIREFGPKLSPQMGPNLGPQPADV